MRRHVLVFALTGALGCAHSKAPAREPANVSPSRFTTDVANQPYRDAVVAEAFLLGPPNARGERSPVCWLNPAGRPDLVPRFIRTDARGLDVDFGLPACSDDQVARIQTIAARDHGNETALVPVVGAAVVGAATVCAIDFALTAAITMAINSQINRAVKPGDRAEAGGNAFGLATVGVGGVSAIASVIAGLGVMSNPFLFGSVITTCTFAGGAVGYYLLPLK